MPEENTTSESVTPTESTSDSKTVSFKLEKVDAENVRKIDSHPDVTVIHIPSLQKEKTEIEGMIEKLKSQLAQIDEVLSEYAKLQ